jgi:hypothetical protein
MMFIYYRPLTLTTCHSRLSSERSLESMKTRFPSAYRTALASFFLVPFSVSLALGVLFGLGMSILFEYFSLNLYRSIKSYLVALAACTCCASSITASTRAASFSPSFAILHENTAPTISCPNVPNAQLCHARRVLRGHCIHLPLHFTFHVHIDERESGKLCLSLAQRLRSSLRVTRSSSIFLK